ncbi:class I SAM-dependent methyltransferase [Luteolibacter yonseiensis]|uniref:Class I SAM-dependent methyltransferase n=1 Tax=Luteolibacter yonseiensis TaxID=1144680 RepID=A0A934V934_9BACT|nr:class I SAM-dependent methyltransferase [Luteolibacter yonseiensis]MBK1817897.1 class I SAM-dependent methyltransferase [Luteolibacter yonseiensis]
MEGSQRNPKGRFSDRVENYIKYRPSYPPEVLELLKSRCGQTEESVIADVGSGTGILTKLLLENAERVYGVEPNREMREAAERMLADQANFTSIPGSAEATDLLTDSVDIIVAGQAFHWFDRPRAKKEFHRILRPNGWVVLIWNERETDSTPFLREYEVLLRKYAMDYQEVDHMKISPEILREFYDPATYETGIFSNRQQFDYEGLKGRCLSSSYIPNAGQPGHDDLIEELEALFAKYESGGQVEIGYQTMVYYGRL